MFATLLMKEARTQARRNMGVVGSMALVAMPAVVSIQIGIAALASAAVATLLVAGWFASFAHLLGVTLEQVLEPVRQMVSLVGIGSVVVAPILAAILVWWRCEPSSGTPACAEGGPRGSVAPVRDRRIRLAREHERRGPHE